MTSIFDFDQYKDFVNAWLNSRPKNGRGLLTEIARELGIHTTLLSHTLRGDKNLSSEQGILLADYMGLSELEADYFLLLLQRERAGNLKLRQKYDRDIENLRISAQEVSKRVVSHLELSDADRAQFYSSWLYSALRQLTSIKSTQDPNELSKAFDIKKEEFNRILKFLLETGLCLMRGSRIEIGPANTHIESNSPFVFLHHKNWRIKALEKHNRLDSEDLMYTAPFTISAKDLATFREEVIKLIQKLIKVAGKTENEKLACLNVDLFLVKR